MLKTLTLRCKLPSRHFCLYFSIDSQRLRNEDTPLSFYFTPQLIVKERGKYNIFIYRVN